MLIILGEILIAIGTVYFCLILLSARDPHKKQTWWNKSWMFDSIHLSVVLGSLVIGPGLLIKGMLHLETVKESILQAAGFLALLTCTVFVIKKLNIKQRLAEFEAQKNEGADIIAMPSKTGSFEEPKPQLKKAA